MSKTIVIHSCDDCPYFDNQYYDYSEECGKSRRRIKRNPQSFSYPIPDDCPLGDVHDTAEDYIPRVREEKAAK